MGRRGRHSRFCARYFGLGAKKPPPAPPAAASALDPQADRDDTKDPPGTKRLMPDGKVWLDLKNKRVIVVGEVCQREGQMEMFACLKGTKEHESIVAVPTKAHVVHAALIRLGALPGSAAQFVPKYRRRMGRAWT